MKREQTHNTYSGVSPHLIPMLLIDDSVISMSIYIALKKSKGIEQLMRCRDLMRVSNVQFTEYFDDDGMLKFNISIPIQKTSETVNCKSIW